MTTTRIFQTGELLAGKYRVDHVIGEGGMGVVLAARHDGLGTDVAIKLLRAEGNQNPEVRGRFLREARAAVSLKSAHVARVFDVGALEDGCPFIVMELLEGKDLGDLIDEEPPVRIGAAVDYVLQACEAIAEAHALGIVHRDLKPKNLFLTRSVDGRPLVKVLDFGISKAEAPEGATDEMQLTGTTVVLGSPNYMSPEQLRSLRSADLRSDVWALGVILYELLTKRLPFDADTVVSLAVAVATERERPIRDLRPDCPEELTAVVARCLAKRPEDRFQSILSLVEALEPFAEDGTEVTAERIRAVVSRRGSGSPPSASRASSGDARTPSSRSPHAGTTLAWGESRSTTGDSTTGESTTDELAYFQDRSRAKRRFAGAISVLAALSVVGVFVVGAIHLARDGAAFGTAPSATLPASAPTLPPLEPPAVDPVPSAPPVTAPVGSNVVAAPSTSVTAIARKPSLDPSVSRPSAAPAPSAKSRKTDDLSSIGRR